MTEAAQGSAPDLDVGVSPSHVAVPNTPVANAFCSIERTIGIIGDRWTLLILREALTREITQFSELRRALGAAPNILTNRLDLLVQSGILYKREYQEPGARTRMAYHPTEAGRELLLVLAAMGQWGDDHIPPPSGVAQTREISGTGERVRVGFVTDSATLRASNEIAFVYTPEGEKNMRGRAQGG